MASLSCRLAKAVRWPHSCITQKQKAKPVPKSNNATRRRPKGKLGLAQARADSTIKSPWPSNWHQPAQSLRLLSNAKSAAGMSSMGSAIANNPALRLVSSQKGRGTVQAEHSRSPRIQKWQLRPFLPCHPLIPATKLCLARSATATWKPNAWAMQRQNKPYSRKPYI